MRRYGRLPVAEAFAEVYRRKDWGQVEGERFCSGFGSGYGFAVPYAEWVNRFIAERGITTVVDVGCGDFRVGRRICSASTAHYIGVDIVPDLIAHNKARFGRRGIDFLCANVIESRPPHGDICLIRQVLQHLSNVQISRVLANCATFRYLVITEDIYAGSGMRPNLEKPHGPDNRLFKRSGVYLDLPPYSLKAQNVLEIAIPATRSIVRTLLIDKSTAS
jgi:SAM-dependent methyltransferase